MNSSSPLTEEKLLPTTHNTSPQKTQMSSRDKDTLLSMDELQLQTSQYGDSPVRGEMSVPSSSSGTSNLDTLDEPVTVTLKRDLKAIASKFMHVLYPRNNQALLRDWDLWGPLFLCVFISLLINWETGTRLNGAGPRFSQVFIIISAGSCIVTLNSALLGGTISFFQSVCVLGYCLLPTAVALIICKIILITGGQQTSVLFVLRLLVTCLGFGWAVFASTAFLSGSQPRNRKALAVYPVFLFYFIVSWLIISQTHYGH